MSPLFNQHVIRGTLAPFLLVTCLLTPAHATSFNWSYTWATGTEASGMLVGSESRSDPNIIFIDDIMGGISTFPDVRFITNSTANTVSRDGTNMHANIIDIVSVGGFRGFIIVSAINNIATFSRFGQVLESEPYRPNSWRLSEKTDPIPEPTTLMLFGTGMLGLIAWARRKKKAAAI